MLTRIHRLWYALVLVVVAGASATSHAKAVSWTGKLIGPGTILDLETGKTEHFQSEFGRVEEGALSPDGSQLALIAASSLSEYEPRQVEIIDRRSGARKVVMRIDGSAAVEWSPDGRFLFVVSLGRAWIVRHETRTTWSAPGRYTRWGDSCRSLTLVEPQLTPDARGDSDLQLFEYNAGQPKRLAQHFKDGILEFVFSPDGRQLGFTGQDSDVWIRPLGTGAVRRLTRTPLSQERVQFWSPDSRLLVAYVVKSVGDRGRFEAWEAATGKKYVPPFNAAIGDERSIWHHPQWWAPIEGPRVDCSAAVQQALGSSAQVVLDAESYPPNGRRAR